MKKIFIEQNLVVLLFILVLVVFSFAERDTKKLDKVYSLLEPKARQIAMEKDKADQPTLFVQK